MLLLKEMAKFSPYGASGKYVLFMDMQGFCFFLHMGGFILSLVVK
jgi:hypothetical protein